MSAVAALVEQLRPYAEMLAVAQAARRATRPATVADLERDWRTWLGAVVPRYVAHPFGERHEHLWDWAWAVEPGAKPHPFVGIWARGGAKSTSAELATAVVGARGKRRYGLYISDTQDRADDHVGNVAAVLESSEFARYYPTAADRLVGKYGNAKGWRRNRVRTASGFTVDAIGLDVAARGIKLEDARPDWLVFDDIDASGDGPQATAKKLQTITRALLPAGSSDCAVLAIQNLVIPDGVFARLADGRADFLADRIVSGPHPAVEGLVIEPYTTGDGRTRYRIVAGEATWAGQPLPVCERQINEWGPTAFLAEAQHNVEPPPGGLFDQLTYRHCHPADCPDFVRTTVWCDPAITQTDGSDSYAVQGDGLAADGTIYRLRSWEEISSPEEALETAIVMACAVNSTTVGVETDQGGDVWAPAYWRVAEQLLAAGTIPYLPHFRSAKASQGYGSKVHRASQMLADYEFGRIVHVIGTHGVLERALRRFPKTKPFDLTDASFWSWADLRGLVPDDNAAPGIVASGGASGWGYRR